MKKIKASEFDKFFHEGKEDIVDYLDLTSVRKINAAPKRVNVDFPIWMVRLSMKKLAIWA